MAMHEEMPVPQAGAVPPMPARMENLSARQRAWRKAASPRTRLTQKMQEDICASLRLGTPRTIAAEAAGISRNTLTVWMRTAHQAERKHWNDRSQIERRCLLLREAIRQAEAEAALRVHGQIASAAGLTRERPTKRVTRQRIVGGTVDDRGQVSGGTLAEAIIETVELPGDWRAAAHLASYRWPVEMGGAEEPEPEVTVMPDSRVMFARLQQALAEPTTEDVIEATATSALPEGNPPDETATR